MNSAIKSSRILPVAYNGDEIRLLGVRFDHLSRSEALAAMSGIFGKGKAQKVYIVNAHTSNLAYRYADFREVLNSADLLLNDGAGIQIASHLVGKPFPDNLVGTDLVPQLCEIAVKRDVSVFLLGGKHGVPEMAAKKLMDMIPGLKVSGVQHGYYDEEETQAVIRKINSSGAGILLVAFGNPLQEMFIHRHAKELECDVCIGIGGLIDYLGGDLQRAPRWVRRMRFEWLYILVRQPHKWRRYLLGNPLFLARVFISPLREKIERAKHVN